MKKKVIIISSILLILSLTGLKLYKKYQKAEIKAQQQEELRKQGERILQYQKEARITKYKEEEKRIKDSIANVKTEKLNKGLQMLKEARENLQQNK